MAEPKLATVDGQFIDAVFGPLPDDATAQQKAERAVLLKRGPAIRAAERARTLKSLGDTITTAVNAACAQQTAAHAQALEQLGNAATERERHIRQAARWGGVAITSLLALALAAGSSFLTYQITMQTQVNTAAMARAVNAPRGLQDSPELRPQEGGGFH